MYNKGKIKVESSAKKTNPWNRDSYWNPSMDAPGWLDNFDYGGPVSHTGYKRDSPDRHNSMNVIPSNQITMAGVDKNLLLLPIEDNGVGNPVLAKPGDGDYLFPRANMVMEMPLPKNTKMSYERVAKDGGWLDQYPEGGQIYDRLGRLHSIASYVPEAQSGGWLDTYQGGGSNVDISEIVRRAKNRQSEYNTKNPIDSASTYTPQYIEHQRKYPGNMLHFAPQSKYLPEYLEKHPELLNPPIITPFPIVPYNPNKKLEDLIVPYKDGRQIYDPELQRMRNIKKQPGGEVLSPVGGYQYKYETAQPSDKATPKKLPKKSVVEQAIEEDREMARRALPMNVRGEAPLLTEDQMPLIGHITNPINLITGSIAAKALTGSKAIPSAVRKYPHKSARLPWYSDIPFDDPKFVGMTASAPPAATLIGAGIVNLEEQMLADEKQRLADEEAQRLADEKAQRLAAKEAQRLADTENYFTNYAGSTPDSVYASRQLWSKYGKPHINVAPIEDSLLRGRAHYYERINKMNLDPRGQYSHDSNKWYPEDIPTKQFIAEMAHAQQRHEFHNTGLKTWRDTSFNTESGIPAGPGTKEYDDYMYGTTGTKEYDAHELREPKLYQEYDSLLKAYPAITQNRMNQKYGGQWLDQYQYAGEYKWDPSQMQTQPQVTLPTVGTYSRSAQNTAFDNPHRKLGVVEQAIEEDREMARRALPMNVRGEAPLESPGIFDPIDWVTGAVAARALTGSKAAIGALSKTPKSLPAKGLPKGTNIPDPDFAKFKYKFGKYKKEGLSPEQKQMMKEVDNMMTEEKRAAGNAMGTVDDIKAGFPDDPYLSLQNPQVDPFDLSWDPGIKRTGWTNISNLPGYDPVHWWKNLLQYGKRPLLGRENFATTGQELRAMENLAFELGEKMPHYFDVRSPYVAGYFKGEPLINNPLRESTKQAAMLAKNNTWAPWRNDVVLQIPKKSIDFDIDKEFTLFPRITFNPNMMNAFPNMNLGPRNIFSDYKDFVKKYYPHLVADRKFTGEEAFQQITPNKYGGPTPAKAREILHDGTAHGKALTDKQKRYFGWIAGGRKQYGGLPTASSYGVTPRDQGISDMEEYARRQAIAAGAQESAHRGIPLESAGMFDPIDWLTGAAATKAFTSVGKAATKKALTSTPKSLPNKKSLVDIAKDLEVARAKNIADDFLKEKFKDAIDLGDGNVLLPKPKYELPLQYYNDRADMFKGALVSDIGGFSPIHQSYSGLPFLQKNRFNTPYSGVRALQEITPNQYGGTNLSTAGTYGVTPRDQRISDIEEYIRRASIAGAAQESGIRGVPAEYVPLETAFLPAARGFGWLGNLGVDAVTGSMRSPGKLLQSTPKSLPHKTVEKVKELSPYIGRRTPKMAKEEEVFNSFLSPETQYRKELERTIHYDPKGNVIPAPKNWLEGLEQGGTPNWLDDYNS